MDVVEGFRHELEDGSFWIYLGTGERVLLRGRAAAAALDACSNYLGERAGKGAMAWEGLGAELQPLLDRGARLNPEEFE